MTDQTLCPACKGSPYAHFCPTCDGAGMVDANHYLIRGAHSDLIIGCTTKEGQADVLAEEPDATFMPITLEECGICQNGEEGVEEVRPLTGYELGRLAFITEQSITRRGLFPKYGRYTGYVAFHQLLKEYKRQRSQLEAENEALRGEIEHAYSFDSTASHFEHCEDRSWGSLTDEQRQYWIERARQEDDVPIGSLRVWNVINPPGEPEWHPVETPEEGARLIDQLANEQLKNPVIFVNAFGLCEWDGEEWTEWYDDIGNEVDSILKENDDLTVS